MGSIISLGVGHLEIDWGKNEFFRDHSKLFLKDDIHPATYYYAEGHNETKPAYTRSLRSVLKRLDLLGYTMEDCRTLYEEIVQSVPDYYPEPLLTFDQLGQLLRLVDVDRLALPEDEGDYSLGELAKAILSDPEFLEAEPTLETLTSDDGTFFENLDPYIVLRLLGENPANLDRDVIWRFQDILDGGWIAETEVYGGLADTNRYLVVTEGSSDSSILQASLPIVEPDVADFFHFIDMAENYPFTGTGNLVRFCQGLASIKIQSNILVVLDNDTAGRDAFLRIKKIALPKNLRVTLLPQLDEMTHFRTLGPSGETIEDVNGNAVSIECFLDLSFAAHSLPAIRWTSFNAELDIYQGELINKAEYTRVFFRETPHNSNYKVDKLAYLWKFLLAGCTK